MNTRVNTRVCVLDVNEALAPELAHAHAHTHTRTHAHIGTGKGTAIDGKSGASEREGELT